MIPTSVTRLFQIQYPVIQGGMVWTSGWRLASAVSNAGGLGLLGAASMTIPLLKEHIQKMKAATTKPFGVNIPLLYKDTEKQIECALSEGVQIIFTSAGSPKKVAMQIKPHATFVHVASTAELAKKCEDAGCDAVVVEGFEAGGHNGRDELTTMVLVPMSRKSVKIPLIAAGGIGSGQAIAAALALGADGVQIGSRFAMTKESSLHDNFKNAVAMAGEACTRLSLKKLIPVRLLHSDFEKKIRELEDRCASKEELAQFLGKGRAKKGMFEGDLKEGELEIGQIAGLIGSIETVDKLFDNFKSEFEAAQKIFQK